MGDRTPEQGCDHPSARVSATPSRAFDGNAEAAAQPLGHSHVERNVVAARVAQMLAHERSDRRPVISDGRREHAWTRFSVSARRIVENASSSPGQADQMLVSVRHDFSEFSADRPLDGWRRHVPADADPDVRVDEALGHTVGRRDKLYDDADFDGAQTRKLHLIDAQPTPRGKLEPAIAASDGPHAAGRRRRVGGQFLEHALGEHDLVGDLS
jgi:hypothetical protein